ncbi:MAG: sulfurtransferase TusA family protein, partial [Candidatus Omnitrophica bacterium]|nr:sulfurtransferase TusA family protein [Candidatus Omnitrophota bacterium]
TLLDIVACKGSLTCNLGLCNSPGLAKEVEAIIQKDFIGTKVFDKLAIKLNGCPNACGQHPIGIVSLHGAARKISGHAAPFYKLFLGGRVGGLEDTRLARDTNILIPARNVPLFLRDFLRQIDSRINEDTDIYKYIEEEGEALAKEVAADYSRMPAYAENKDFYRDWGKQEEFSLEGLGPGECGAGVLDMIDADLADAKIALDAGDIKRALFLSARSLLVVKGADPKTEDEALSGFVDKFVKENIASDDYRNLKEVFYSKELDSAYANKFLSHVKGLYKNMDSSFNFPKLEKGVKAQAPAAAKLLDLKGTACPINYVKAKLFIEDLAAGEVAEVLLDEGEPIRNVPTSLKNDGHQILNIEKIDGYYKVTVKKA